MLYHLSPYLEVFWGPFRLLRSHALLLTGGTLAAALSVVFLLPFLWQYAPHDHGKAILGKDGMKSAGKPTGTGFLITLILLPIVLMIMPLSWPVVAMIFFLYVAMVCGYLDDRAEKPWGQLKKGLLDAFVSLGVAAVVWYALDGIVWLPFITGEWHMPWWAYVPVMGGALFFLMNATNCSDGVDGLAGSLSVVSLVAISILLYAVVGYRPMSDYLLVPHNYLAVRWAVFTMIVAGGFSGYLWWNAESSKVLMGDAGSRFLGLLLGAGILVTGNPFLMFAFAPVVLVNGGGGLVKIILLRTFRKLGLDVRPPSMLDPEEQERKNPLVKIVQSVRFPLHDHCKKELKWTNAQVLMRFILLQAFIMPIILILIIKIR